MPIYSSVIIRKTFVISKKKKEKEIFSTRVAWIIFANS